MFPLSSSFSGESSTIYLLGEDSAEDRDLTVNREYTSYKPGVDICRSRILRKQNGDRRRRNCQILCANKCHPIADDSLLQCIVDENQGKTCKKKYQHRVKLR